MYAGVKVGTVEEFQGRECQVIIISTVSRPLYLKTCLIFIGSAALQVAVPLDSPKVDPKEHFKFIASPKRLNVAISRAQALLLIIGHPETLQAVCTINIWDVLSNAY